MRVKQKVGTKGSLKWIQLLIEYHPELLAHALEEAGALAEGAVVMWASPREKDDWAEYRDAFFLRQLGLDEHADALRSFWPPNGPQWDALGRTTDGRVILVEAKAHVGELASTCSAVSEESRERIKSAFSITRTALGAQPDGDWMTGYYQYANRLAHLQFLRSRGVDAHLVFLYFTNDADMPEPHDRAGFEQAVKQAHAALGFQADHAIPYVVDVFLDVSELAKPASVGSAEYPERHLPSFDYRSRFPEIRTVRVMEGGAVYAARGPEGFAVITDEGMMNEMIGEDDMESVSIRVFDTEVARDAYLRERRWQ